MNCLGNDATQSLPLGFLRTQPPLFTPTHNWSAFLRESEDDFHNHEARWRELCATYLFLALLALLALLVPVVLVALPCLGRISCIKSMTEEREDKRRCSRDSVGEEQGCSDGVLSTRNVLLCEVNLQQDN
jgi:hypothetical protein